MTEEQALKYTTFYACVSLIAGTIGALPIRLVHRGDKSRREVRTPDLRHVWGKPNPSTGRIPFWETRTASLVMWGNSYNFKGVDSQTGKIAALWGINPNRVEVRQERDLSKTYRLDRDDKQIYDQRTIQQIMAMGTDGIKGLSVVGQAADAIGLALAEERFGSTFFTSPGSNLAAVVQLPPGLGWDKERAADFRADWESAYNRQHPVGFLTEGATYTRIGIPPNEAQFLESRAFQRDEMASIFKIPPTLIGLVQKTSAWGKGVEQLTISFITYCLIPWITRIEESISDELLPDDIQAKLVVSGLLRGDTQTRWQTYMWARQNGILSADDIREFEDLPPRGIADDFLSPINMARIPAPATGANDASTIREMQAVIAERLRLEPIAASVEQTLIKVPRCPNDGKRLGANSPANLALYCRACKAEVLPVEG